MYLVAEYHIAQLIQSENLNENLKSIEMFIVLLDALLVMISHQQYIQEKIVQFKKSLNGNINNNNNNNTNIPPSKAPPETQIPKTSITTKSVEFGSLSGNERDYRNVSAAERDRMMTGY